MDLVFIDLAGGPGGPQHSLAELANGLRQIGTRPHLIAAEDSGARPMFESSFGAEISFIHAPHAKHHRATAVARGVRSAVKRLHPDLVIANTPSQLRVALAAAPRQRMMFGLRNSFYVWTEQLQMLAAALARPDLTAFAPSHFAKSLAPKPLRPRVSVVPNPVAPISTDREPMENGNGHATVGVVSSGRAYIKGADLLPPIIRAAAARPFHWRVFGIDPDDPPAGSAVAEAVRELQAEPSVELVGRPPFARQLSSLDFVLIVSRRESFGRVAAESMSAGRVVIAPRHTGLTETLAGGTAGLLYEPGNPNAAAAELIRAYDDAEFRKRLSEAARRHAAEHFTPERVAKQFLEVASAHA